VPVLTPDLAAALARWPVFAPAAMDLGARALFVFPLRVGAIGVGTMLAHRNAPGALTAAQTRLAEAQYEPELMQVKAKFNSDDMKQDEMFDDAVKVVLETRRGSVSLLQRRLNIDHGAVLVATSANIASHGFPALEGIPPFEVKKGWLAVSETALVLDDNARKGGYDWLKKYEPVERVGRSIRLYHIE